MFNVKHIAKCTEGRWLVAGALCAFVFTFVRGPVFAAGEGTAVRPDCRWIDRRVYELSQHADADSLGKMLGLIPLSRECHGTDIDETLVIWLLEKEIFGLRATGDEAGACELTGRFFNEHFAAASNAVRANLYGSRFRCRALAGDLLGAVASYHEGQAYSASLPLDRRLQRDIDAAYAYTRIASYADALRLVEVVLASADSLPAVQARAIAQKGVILMYQGKADDAARLLTHAAARADSLGLDELCASALADLSQVQPPGQAIATGTRALRLAERAASPNVVIFALYRRASLRTQAGALLGAESDLSRAVSLMDSTGLREYAAEVFELLGSIYEQQARRDAALTAYQRAVESAKHRQGVETLKAARRAEMALVRAALDRAADQDEVWLIFVLFLVMMVSVTLGYNLCMFRVTPNISADIRSSDTMQAPAPESDPPSLWDRRLGYLYRVLVDARCALPHLDEGDKVADVIRRRGKVYQLTELRIAAAALETHHKGTFLGTPATTYRGFFASNCKRRAIVEPGSVEEWRDFFRSAS